MGTSVFLSYPKPFTKEQESFVKSLSEYLVSRGFEPRTLGVTDYDMDSPLKAIRRLMLESNGLITIAFRRALIISGSGKPSTNEKYTLDGQWLTSPYSHIEPAMAFQIGLPVLIAYSGAIQPPIPGLSGHPFRFKPDTISGINQPFFALTPESVSG